MNTNDTFKAGDMVQHYPDGLLLRVAGYHVPAYGEPNMNELIECIPLDGNPERDRLIFHESALMKVTDLLKPGLTDWLSKIRNLPHPPRNVA